MPIYKYTCTSCIIEFEKIMSMRMAESVKRRLGDTVDCPECGSHENITPLLPSTNFKLAGKGWYRDGYTQDDS